MSLRFRPRFWHPGALVALLVLLVVSLSVVQYRWLGELASAARDRLDRDLRVTTQSVASAVEEAVARLIASLETAPGDSTALGRVLAEWETANPGLAGLVGAVGRRSGDTWVWHQRTTGAVLLSAAPAVATRRAMVRWDSVFVANRLLPALKSRIAMATELAVTVALVHRDSSGGEAIVARTAPLPDTPADVSTPLLTGDGELTMIFVGDRGPRLVSPPAPGLAWTGDSAGGERTVVLGAGYALRAWHASGSLEGAVAVIQRRNLLIGFGLLALLSLVGAHTLLSFRRNQRLAEDRATVLAGISHEIRTPLAVIRSAADNLRSGVVHGDQAVAEYGAMIDDQADRLATTVASAVAFARSAHHVPGEGELVELATLARAVVAHSAAPERITIVAADQPRCRGDADALAMAVGNLVANALDYAPGDSTVEVALRATPRQAVLTVADRGPGLAEEERARVFEPFVRGTAGRAARQGGLGLGLSLAHRVATLHGGDLAVASRPGGGTVFTLTLPAARG